MEENNKGGFSAEGRKLRPRRPRISGKVYSSTEGPAERRRSFGSSDRRSSYGSSEGRSHGNSEGRSYGSSERRSYGSSEGRSYGNSERRSYGNSDRRSSYGRSSYGNSENRGYGNSERRSYGSSEGRSYGNSENRSYGNSERRSSYGSSEHRSFGPSGRRAFNGNHEGSSFGSRDNRSFRGAKPAGRGTAPRGKASMRKPAGKPNPYKFNDTDEQNMNMILSRKPQLDQIQLSDNDYVETPIKETIRLNKFIANSGICSRREADQYIQAGVVTVNGEVVTELGSKVNVLSDDVRFNGERLRGEEKVYIVMNKPKGFVTTASDPHADKTVMDLLKNCKARVFPVGRLDKNTTGVLMFTNDGEIAERLTHPSYDKKKIYQVILDKPIAQEDFDKVVNGITLNDGDIKADELEYIDAEDHRKLGIEIHSGKNRIVRRIFESLGYDVKALDRVYFAGLTKKGLKKGEWRYLSEGEANVLKMGAYV
ncbi:MAG: pseudouridine synthase [Bacteroides sp.]|nr:pseudouridine synthase [Bacteroides sp.]MDD6149058.1 pseudouridine synthase [Bacteroides sp.]MDY2973391.1 pseudouridine synthase [Candidatus Cryptobacteroides sp.]MED9900832.1 pseudouridine synthase [Bacteroidales bacterium]HAW07466.1 pseudouridine synthase [Rikenellaceae bacterium]